MLIQSGEAHALLSHSHYLHKSVSRLYIQRHDIDPRSVLFTGPYNYGYILHVTGLTPEITNPRNYLLPSRAIHVPGYSQDVTQRCPAVAAFWHLNSYLYATCGSPGRHNA